MELNIPGKIIPVVVLRDTLETIPVVDALRKGGIRTAEITFRTPCAADCIRLAKQNFPDMVIGAGTVINGEQCRRAIEAGACYIVSPGFSAEVYSVCEKNGVPYLPGAVTATEIMTVLSYGCSTIKFFPAEAFGGLKTLQALASAFPQVRFIPTGGIDAGNYRSYLEHPFVAAVGGSWMTKGKPEDMIRLSTEATEGLL